MKEGKRLNWITIAFLYVGTIMGAGFASGREIWQFFGIFSETGYLGIGLSTLLFILMGSMAGLIGKKLGTNDIGKIVVPRGMETVATLVGGFMAFILFTVLIAMSAAGGALFKQVLGQSPVMGGGIIVFLVVLTVLGGFDRISHVFQVIMPLLLILMIGICLLIIFKVDGNMIVGDIEKVEPSPLASHWAIASLLYVSYNVLAIIPIMAVSAIHGKSLSHVLGGTILGGTIVGIIIFLMVLVMGKNPEYSQSLDLPLIAYAKEFSIGVAVVYEILLFIAIYASATTNYYGFTTKIPPSIHRKKMVIGMAIVGFLLGLIGFRNVVAYLFPVEGILGIGIMLMIMTNFTLLMKDQKEKRTVPTPVKDFEDHDRFHMPKDVYRVTAGFGGEALLIVGTEKTALYDCGMAYCGEKLVQNIESVLGNRPLDYVFLSHTHYDHIGALPYVRKRWNKVQVFGSSHGQYVLSRQGALRTIKELGEFMRDQCGDKQESIPIEGMAIDQVIGNGERISLGDKEVEGIEAKGHTDCSMAYLMEPDGVFFAAESTGVLEGEDALHTAILKSYEDSMETLRRCKALPIKYIISPHYGLVPTYYNREYWNLFERKAKEERDFVQDMWKKNLSEEEMLECFTEKYRRKENKEDYPLAAFLVNTKCVIKAHKPKEEEG